jgi:hypothetical protein
MFGEAMMVGVALGLGRQERRCKLDKAGEGAWHGKAGCGRRIYII